MSDDPADPAARFIETMGRLVQGEGLPRIAGRLMGLLMMDDRPHSFAELTERLEVSRASVSTNVRMLEHLGLIEPAAVAGSRHRHFRLADDPYVRLVERQCSRGRCARETVARAMAEMPAQALQARRRLGQLLGYYDAQLELSDALLARLRGQDATDGEPES